MKAVNNYIIVDEIKESLKEIGGMVFTEELDEDNRYFKGKIISVGNLIEGLKDGDIIFYDKHAGHGITWNDKLYYVIRVNDVVLVE
tara:strand:+ start:5732 stop:5989 length:258 start_codon:yes stop_codon:yes gene_type:complete